MGDITLDEREFAKAFREVLATHKKDAPTFLNKKALSVMIGSKGHPGAVKLTPEASKEKIDAVPRKLIAGFVIKRAKKAGNWPLSGPEIDALIDKERKRRKSAIAYTRGAGWLKAAQALGGRGVSGAGKIHPEFSKSKAAKGYARRASESTLEVVIANAAPAAEKIGGPALQEAVDEQAADMRAYAAQEHFGKTFAKHSAK